MSTVTITATAGEILQAARALKFAVGDLPENRTYTVTLNDAPGGGSKWSVTDPKGGVRKG
jgi:hypothetical protein